MIAKYWALVRQYWPIPTRRDFGPIIAALLFAGVSLAMLALSMAGTGKEGRTFTGEPQDVLKGDWYVGAFSSLGGVVWFTCAAILTFALAFWPRHMKVLAAAAMLSWAMGIDDIFLLHDHVYPMIYLRQELIFLGYFGAVGGILLMCAYEMPPRTTIGVAVTIGFWGLSAVLDQFFNFLDQSFEDGAKFTGICVWAATWIAQGYDSLRERADPQTEPGAG